jgi:hypothetical protein
LLFHFCIEKCSYATSGAGTACHSGPPESNSELRVFCRSLLVLFSFFFWPLCCPIPLRYTDSDYPYGIFKLFFKRSKQKSYIQQQSEESKRKVKLWSTGAPKW